MPYTSNLTDKEWDLIKDEVNKEKVHPPGRRPVHSKREMLDAAFYALKNGCAWSDLPKDFPPWGSVYTQFRRWKQSGFFERIQKFIRQGVRQLLGRNLEASAGSESQRVKTAEKGALQVLMEGGIKGRKRHILVDTEGFLIDVAITPKNESDKSGFLTLLRSKN